MTTDPAAVSPGPGPERRAGRDLSPNMRAIRLTMRIAELQLARGVSARDVVVQGLDITETYCERRVWFDVVASLVVASQDRGHDREPLTLIRTVAPAEQNNMLVQDLQDLVEEIVTGLPLDSAEERLDRIIARDRSYPVWLRTVGFAGVGAGYALLFSTSWVVIVATFLIGMLVDVVMRALNRKMTPPFFVQAVASCVITLFAVGVGELGQAGIAPFVGVSPTLIVVGGVVALVAGLTIYATAADAIDEFFLTAGARLLKTFMMTAGIVAGIMVGIGVADLLGSDIPIPLEPVGIGFLPVTMVGAVATGAAWAAYTQGSRAAIAWAGLISMVGWFCYVATMGIGDIGAKGIGALAIGFSAGLVTRVGKIPTIAIVDAALVTLVPGLSLLMGLMKVTQSPTPLTLSEGLILLLSALGVAVAIAAGSSLGAFLSRPLRSRLIRVRTFIPTLAGGRRSRRTADRTVTDQDDGTDSDAA